MALPLSVTEQLQYSTVRLEVETPSGGTGTGTAFSFRFPEKDSRHVPVIVTNKHVVADASKGKFRMTVANAEGNPVDTECVNVVVEDSQSHWIHHPDPSVDLAVLPIGPLVRDAADRGKRFFRRSLDPGLIPSQAELEELTTVEDILMVGYPNGIWDALNNLPVFRRGVTATHPAKFYNGRPEFMIDVACFPGSSGSPVFLYNPMGFTNKHGQLVLQSRLRLLGILYAGPQHTVKGELQIMQIPTRDAPVPISRIPNNLGNVIRAEKLLDFEPLMRQLIQGTG